MPPPLYFIVFHQKREAPSRCVAGDSGSVSRRCEKLSEVSILFLAQTFQVLEYPCQFCCRLNRSVLVATYLMIWLWPPVSLLQLSSVMGAITS